MAQAKNQALLDLIQPIIDEQGLLLWDLSVKNVAGQKTVELLVDLPDHDKISMAQITEFTRAVNEAIDEAAVDPVPGEYLLDIASPGLDRSLNERWHYTWAKEEGEPITVALFAAKDGQKKWTGRIDQLDDAGLTLSVDGEAKPFSFDEIAKAVVSVQFD
ncbi:ribosome maturation factor RimP [Fructobacillus parabroussonetiae]|uniref:Ribosome maturation factor RimP n=1 Tax=Fructobacillus parabroussonetiae TaxID=2713174 RepID=A0ABS5QVF5_9LACO|nr:ribosome maturation factor RimP [Fructobacillus parabroussonetiae]MBS9337180.1 ribosome maturation factor RimP [Fructobacillus parabroussonetiae]MCK8617136.1 ribosome maturation factor RimP [Fructobacillus parabroussonetiae]